jgi:hypothetical protein
MVVLTGHTQISMLEADRPDQTETSGYRSGQTLAV